MNISGFAFLKRHIRHVAYAGLFWPLFLLVRSLDITCRVLRIADVSAALRRRAQRQPRILFLSAFFPGNAGFEERANAWARVLDEAGFSTQVSWCLPRDRFWDLLVAGKVAEFQIAFMAKRLLHCIQAVFFDAVVVQRELFLYNDYGGTFGERFLLSMNKRVALDIDDDISAAKGEPRSITLFGHLLLESGTKFADSLSVYPHFIVGSSYLKELVRDHRAEGENDDIAIIPTCVDIAAYPRKRYATTKSTPSISFGWIGSSGNLPYLDIVMPSLEAVARDHTVKLVVVSSEAYRPGVGFEVENVPWSYATQGDSLQQIDIGLMPLFDSAAERGKCGFKLLQYMACGIVSIASAITTNAEILTDGEDGFLVFQPDDWERVIRRALAESPRFPTIGAKAVARVRDRYTFEANRDAYLRFCQALCARETAL